MNYFVAAHVPCPRWLDRRLDTAPGELSRLHPDDLHITIAFLGRIDAARIPTVQARMALIPIPPTTISFGRLVPLPYSGRPSAFSLELERGKDGASRWIAEHRQALIELVGGREDTRPPYPHVTIARPRRRAKAPERRIAAEWAGQFTAEPDPITVTQIHLYRSAPASSPRRYEVVALHGAAPALP